MQRKNLICKHIDRLDVHCPCIFIHILMKLELCGIELGLEFKLLGDPLVMHVIEAASVFVFAGLFLLKGVQCLGNFYSGLL